MRAHTTIAVSAAGRRCNKCRRLPNEDHEVWCTYATRQRKLYGVTHAQEAEAKVTAGSTNGAWGPAVYGFVPNCPHMPILAAYSDVETLRKMDEMWNEK